MSKLRRKKSRPAPAAIRLRGRIALELGNRTGLTEAGADLLEQITINGSLSEAARQLHFSATAGRGYWLIPSIAPGESRWWPPPPAASAAAAPPSPNSAAPSFPPIGIYRWNWNISSINNPSHSSAGSARPPLDPSYPAVYKA